MSVKICIIYPTDPFGTKVSGINTFIKEFIKYAPDDSNIEFVGITTDSVKRPVKKWQQLIIGRKEFDFFPLFFEKDENKKTVIPLALRFTFSLKFFKINNDNKILFFNRIEPAILFRKVNFPKIAVIHNDIQKRIGKEKSEILWSRFPWLYFMFESLILKSLNHVYTVSKNTLEFYLAKYAEQKEKFSFLPTSVDIDIFCPIDESKLFIRKKICPINKSLPIENKWILFVGRLQLQKSPIRLIDTFLEYYKRDKTSCLIIIGEGNLRKDIEKYIKKSNIENNVFLLGNMSQDMLVSFYRASDVLLLTSSFEGMPVSVLEALGSGLPVVSTDVGEVKRVVKNNFSGEVVNSFNPTDLAKGLQKVLNNPRVYTSENCVSCILEYTPQKVLKQVYELHRKLESKIKSK